MAGYENRIMRNILMVKVLFHSVMIFFPRKIDNTVKLHIISKKYRKKSNINISNKMIHFTNSTKLIKCRKELATKPI